MWFDLECDLDNDVEALPTRGVTLSPSLPRKRTLLYSRMRKRLRKKRKGKPPNQNGTKRIGVTPFSELFYAIPSPFSAIERDLGERDERWANSQTGNWPGQGKLCEKKQGEKGGDKDLQETEKKELRPRVTKIKWKRDWRITSAARLLQAKFSDKTCLQATS